MNSEFKKKVFQIPFMPHVSEEWMTAALREGWSVQEFASIAVVECLKSSKLDKINQIWIGVVQTEQFGAEPFFHSFDHFDFLIDIKASALEFIEILSKAENLLNFQLTKKKRGNERRRELDRMERANQDLVRQLKSLEKQAISVRTQMQMQRARVASHIHLTHELSRCLTLEDVLTSLRHEIKSEHKMSLIGLSFVNESNNTEFIYLRGGQAFSQKSHLNWGDLQEFRYGHGSDSQKVANELGRPVNRLLVVPILKNQGRTNQNQPTLIFEYQLKDAEMLDWMEKNQRVFQVISVVLDRIFLEGELKSSSYLWEKTFDAIQDPIAIIDKDRITLRSNSAFRFGVGTKKCFQQFAQRTQTCEHCPILRDDQNFEISSRGDGRKSRIFRNDRVYEVQSYTLEKQLVGRSDTYINHYQDITDDLRISEQVVQSEKMSALGHLAGRIAHELSNPLTGIKTLAEFWMQSPATLLEQTRKDFSEVAEAADRCQKIIENLMQFSRSGDQENRETVDLNQLLIKTLPLLKVITFKHSFNLNFDHEIHMVEVVPQLIQQVIFNIIKNAAQSMVKPGVISIGITPSVTAQSAQAMWCLKIEDTGEGIASADLKNIFNPFFTTKSKEEGTGLGLSLSLTIVRRMGGDIQVRSQLGKGTEVLIYLPAQKKRLAR